MSRIRAGDRRQPQLRAGAPPPLPGDESVALSGGLFVLLDRQIVSSFVRWFAIGLCNPAIVQREGHFWLNLSRPRAGEEIALDNDNGYRYYLTMITSFRCRETERIFKGKFSATLPQAIQKAAARKLEIIDAVRDLDDLRTPPGNRLEALSGDRRGQHSIRINEQWRVCFVWQDGNANDVEIVDYR